MNYIKKKYKDKAVEAQIASFTGKGGVTEYQVMLSVTDPCLPFVDQLVNIQQAYAEVLKEELNKDAVAVFRRYFLSDATNQSDLVMSWECEHTFCALSIIQQAPLNGTKIAMWTYLQTEVVADSLRNGMLEVKNGAYTHYWSGGNSNKASNSEYQTRLLLNEYIMQLTEQGCRLADNCIRTWFFVQNVDVNYGGVVKARKEVFVTQNLTEKTHYIASTGIEGRHANPQVFVQLDAYAVKGIQPEQIQYLYAPTHLNPTYEYGVTFERGTAVTYGDRKHVFISGTASIDNRGEILYPGDVIKQAERMMENIATLLKEAGAGVDNIGEAVVYLRDTADFAVIDRFFRERYPKLPHLIVHAPVCRPGWLIETECFAIIPVDEPRFQPL